jgi:hypothetical protein
VGFEGNNKNKLLVFERKLLREIFGPTEERDGTWRIKTDGELDKLIRQGHNKLHKSTKIKLVWPFTANARRKSGGKSIQVETDVKKTTRETKE